MGKYPVWCILPTTQYKVLDFFTILLMKLIDCKKDNIELKIQDWC